MDSFLLDSGLRRLAARALSRRVRGIRDLLDGAVFYGRTWKAEKQDAPLVEVAKLEDVHFDFRDRLVITGRAKIQEALGYKHEAIEQGFKLRCRIGTRANGRIMRRSLNQNEPDYNEQITMHMNHVTAITNFCKYAEPFE